MPTPKVPKKRPKLSYVDGDVVRFEERLHRNAHSPEPRVPAMTATKGKRTRFTGLTTKGAVQLVKAEHARQAKKKSK